ncbi:MAG: CDP-diacylglycerol--glycerol-3-phosphate 3-phosphatidyltransferase [Firmicutes bacterium]|nr:CDP-diacylglycerol--glycerol-3-phosphate 3-phosphatidyltransferase [Bacillota bacterium]
MNLPNKLTILRIVMIPVFMAFFFLTMIPYNYFIAAIVFVLAAATDFLDGYIARKYHLVTNLGKFLDPIADKVLVSTALILMLTVDAILPPLFSIAVAVILARELIVSGFRMVAASRGLVLAADKIGKVKTVFQDLAIFVLLAGYDFFGVFDSSPDSVNPINVAGLVLLVIAAVLTIWSGVSYIVKNREVLKESE